MGQLLGHLAPGQGGEGEQADQGGLEDTDVGVDQPGDVKRDLARQDHAFHRGALLQDRHAGLQVRRANLGHQAGFEAGAEAVFHQVQL